MSNIANNPNVNLTDTFEVWKNKINNINSSVNSIPSVGNNDDQLALNSIVNTKISDLNTSLTNSINTVNGTLDTKISDLNTSLTNSINTVNKDLNDKIDNLSFDSITMAIIFS